MIGRRTIIVVLAVLSVLLFAGCSSSRPPAEPQSALGNSSVTVASFDFPEGVLLGQIYAGALRSAGLRVDLVAAVGPREVLEPALHRGLIEVLPEYAGTAVQFLSAGEDLASPDPTQTQRELARELRGTAIVALNPASAQDANTVVVTKATALRYGLRSVSDLARVASRLVFGGPPECPRRPLCLAGLAQTYGLRFRSFVPLDVGGPLTVQALTTNEIDVGLLFTSDPVIRDRHLVPLRDDRGLQPAENVTPLVRAETLRRFGTRLSDAIDAVSGRLTQGALVALNARLQAGMSPARAAAAWLATEGLS